MCECVALHHLGFAHHNGGVTCQGFYVCDNCTPSRFHTSTCLPGHTCHFPGKVSSSYKLLPREQIWLQMRAAPLLAHTYACRRALSLALSLAYTNSSSLKLPSTSSNDVRCCMDSVRRYFSFVIHISRIKDRSITRGGNVRFCL